VISLRRISRQVGVPVRELQDWKGIATALGYAALSAGLVRIAADLLVHGGALSRLTFAACGLALAYLPIIYRWRKLA